MMIDEELASFVRDWKLEQGNLAEKLWEFEIEIEISIWNSAKKPCSAEVSKTGILIAKSQFSWWGFFGLVASVTAGGIICYERRSLIVDLAVYIGYNPRISYYWWLEFTNLGKSAMS